MRTGAVVAGAGFVGGTVSGSALGRGNLVSKINSRGYYSWWEENIAETLPDMPAAFRQNNPVDLEGDQFKAAEGGRMVSKPTRGGGISLVVEDRGWGLPGFEYHIGQIGDVDSITVDAQGEGEAQLIAGPFIDVAGDGDYFEWGKTDQTRGNTEEFFGFGVDVETFWFLTPDGGTIDENTPVLVIWDPGVHGPPPEDPPTLGDLTAGDVGPVEPEMDAYMWVGLFNPDGVDGDYVIHDVDVSVE